MPRARHLLLLAPLLACGGDASKPAAPAPAATPAPALAPPAPAPGEPFATPNAKPPPPPVGAIALDKPPLYVQTCDPEHPCPALLQPAGEAHCRDLKLGDYESGWRLPDREEVKRFRGDGLHALEGFHWTHSAYADDPKQAWIVDPVGGQETTIPRDRKPFTVRCVMSP